MNKKILPQDIQELIIGYNCLFVVSDEPITEVTMRAGKQFLSLNYLSSVPDSDKVTNCWYNIPFADLVGVTIFTSERVINDEAYSRFVITTKTNTFEFYYPATEDNDFWDTLNEIEVLMLCTGS